MTAAGKKRTFTRARTDYLPRSSLGGDDDDDDDAREAAHGSKHASGKTSGAAQDGRLARRVSVLGAPLVELSSDELREARRAFAQADSDGNGVLDREEFGRLLRQVSKREFTTVQIDGLYARADVDGSGTISFGEFVQMQLKHRTAHDAAALASLALWAERESVGGSTPTAHAHPSAGAAGAGASGLVAAIGSGISNAFGFASAEEARSEGAEGAEAAASATAGGGTAAGGRRAFKRGSTMPAFAHGAIGRAAGEEETRVDESYRELRQRAITSKVKEMEVSTAELDKLELLFQRADLNLDGKIDFQEFKQVMAMLGETTGKKYSAFYLKTLFIFADIDKSGYIDWNEFLHAQRRLKKNLGQEQSESFLSLAMQTATNAQPEGT